jgi:cytochrome c biogenesis protein CcmG/thiol:disulfide interchange protein DsbE
VWGSPERETRDENRKSVESRGENLFRSLPDDYAAREVRTDRSIATYLITDMPRKAKKAHFCSLALAIVSLIALGACGTEATDTTSKAPDYKRALAGAPKPLAALYAQPNQLLEGGTGAFGNRIDALKGYPVVVNQWASWCGPCRAEFPWFQKASAKYGKQVAFLGVNSQDSDAAAKTFLGEEPVPYPSYVDPDKDIGGVLKATLGLPDTAFFDRSGELVFTKQGPYTDQAALVADIQKYALSG